MQAIGNVCKYMRLKRYIFTGPDRRSFLIVVPGIRAERAIEGRMQTSPWRQPKSPQKSHLRGVMRRGQKMYKLFCGRVGNRADLCELLGDLQK